MSEFFPLIIFLEEFFFFRCLMPGNKFFSKVKVATKKRKNCHFSLTFFLYIFASFLVLSLFQNVQIFTANPKIQDAMALPFCFQGGKKKKVYSLCCVRPPDGKTEGWLKHFSWGWNTHHTCLNPLSLVSTALPHYFHFWRWCGRWECGSWVADDFAGISRLPSLSSSCLRSPAPIGLCTSAGK